MDDEIDQILNNVGLIEKADERAENLSGGEKRKLSVCIALIGDPKLVFLDEPSSGVDPYSRRQIWNLCSKMKQGRVYLN